MEHDEQAERLEHEAERMEQESKRVGEDIEDTRREWESKEQDPTVPGAQPDPEEDEGTAGNVDAAGADD